MLKLRTVSLVAAMLPLLLGAPHAQAAGPLDGLRWLAGTWERATADTTADETWTTPQGAMILGMFRLVEGGTTRFVELQTITAERKDIVLRILHASPELVPWQGEAAAGPLRYVALSVTPGEIVFGNTEDKVKQIIYRLEAPGQLLVRLVKVVDGHSENIDFRFAQRRESGEAAAAELPCRRAPGQRLVATDCCPPVPW